MNIMSTEILVNIIPDLSLQPPVLPAATAITHLTLLDHAAPSTSRNQVAFSPKVL